MVFALVGVRMDSKPAGRLLFVPLAIALGVATSSLLRSRRSGAPRMATDGGTPSAADFEFGGAGRPVEERIARFRADQGR